MTKAQIFPAADDAARAESLKDRQRLTTLLGQTIDALPADSDPAEYARIAHVLVGETLASAVRQGLLPVGARAGLLADCHAALFAVSAGSLTQFQAAAKAALRAVV